MSQEITPARQSSAVMSIVPRTFDEAMKIAVALAKSTMVPTAYRNKPEDVFAAMEMGSRLGMSAMQSVQNIASINGKPCVYGDGFLGVILAFPDFAGIDEDNADKALAQGFGRCKMRRRNRDGTISEVEQRITVEAAKKAGWWTKQGPWSATPGRMLQWRARGWAGRDLFADRLAGIISAEEAMDCVIETTATVSDDMMPRAKATDGLKFPDSAPNPSGVVADDLRGRAADDIPFDAPEPAPNDGELRVIVESVKVETGTNATTGRPWKRYGVFCKHQDGVTDCLGTFSDTLGGIAQGLIGKPAFIVGDSREVGGKTYLDLKAIRPV